MLDNARYGFIRIPRPGSSGSKEGGSKLEGSGPASSGLDVFGSDEVYADPSQDESLDPIKPSVQTISARRSYIDDILVTAGSWDHLCDRVEDLLDACDRWKADPKDLAALTDLPFPQPLRSMQSFLGSLN
ncbi:unnamed protein product [Phytophthora fragariaefolia]|uniref:Unnamed protein product n=1 Tax=Phytophthora fragariaefolia TaxID=1490495 RepID=A0A9W6X226_9STRA|nr:unnamed protein product [Phytophthora fragariaefolia]